MGRSSTMPLRSIGEYLFGIAHESRTCFAALGQSFVVAAYTAATDLRGWRTRFSGEIGLRPILNDPAALLKQEIDLLPSPFFWGHEGARPGPSVATELISVAGSRSFGGGRIRLQVENTKIAL